MATKASSANVAQGSGSNKTWCHARARARFVEETDRESSPGAFNIGFVDRIRARGTPIFLRIRAWGAAFQHHKRNTRAMCADSNAIARSRARNALAADAQDAEPATNTLQPA